MSTQQSGTDDSNLSISRERVLTQREKVTIKSKRGTGTNDRDEVQKTIEREAELDVEDSNLPDLIGMTEVSGGVSDVIQAMREVRDSNQEEE